MKKHLIIYAKRPIPGYAKTRLGSAIGMEASAGIYARMLYSYMFNIMRYIEPLSHVELSVACQDDVEFYKSAFPEYTVRPQVAGDLGVRMEASFQEAFNAGADCAVLTGSDIPGLNGEIVTQAFSHLESHHVVIGPAADGGYYLIGMRSPGFPIFNHIKWGTGDVLAETEKLARNLHLNPIHTPTLTDIDDAVEYEQWLEKLKSDQFYE